MDAPSRDLPTIVMYGLCKWGYITNRPQNLARSLAKYADVVYIDPPIGAGDYLPSLAQALKHVLSPVVERYRVEPGIEVLRTRWRYPFPGKSAAIQHANIRILGKELLRFSRGFDLPPAFWVMYPADYRVLGSVEHSALVYDLVDKHSHFSGQSADRLRDIELSETWLFSQADAVSVTAASLGDYARSCGAANVVSIPNGCDFEHFRRAAHAPRVTASPAIGFVGAIGEWIDFDAIRSVALALPEARVLLAGPFHAPMRQLPADLPSNVEYVGVLRYADLPDFLSGLDLTLVPFVVSALTEAVNPVKVYEYLAAGKPVLATPLPELTDLAPTVELRPAGSFGEAARELLASDNEQRVADRLKLAANNSWDIRADTAVATIREILERRTV